MDSTYDSSPPRHKVSRDSDDSEELGTDDLRRTFNATGKSDATISQIGACQEEEIELHFQSIRASQALNLMPQGIFSFHYKHKWTHGRAIHIAALHKHGAKLAHWLLQKSADVNDFCSAGSSAEAPGKLSWQLQPLHLASGCGNVDVMRVLFENHADLEACTLFNGKDHYPPMHEAVYFMQVPAVKFLLEQSASPNSENFRRQSPLHIAALCGCWRSARELVAAKADLLKEDNDGSTALRTAICTSFPDRKLHHLARPCISDLMAVASEAPSAAEELLQDADAWRKGLTDATAGYELPEATDLVELLAHAPRVASRLLEVLTVQPRVEDNFHDPMPRHACRGTFNYTLCEYTRDTAWRHYPELSSDKGLGDRFRHVLYQQHHAVCGRKKPGVEVKRPGWAGWCQLLLGFDDRIARLRIRMLKLPNVVCFGVLFAIARLKTREEMDVFKKPAVQAILDFAWQHLVRNEYTVNLFTKVLELAVLVWITFKPPGSAEGQRFSWSILTGLATRSIFGELAQIIAHRHYLKDTRAYFENLWNYVDMCTIGLEVALTWGAIRTQQFTDRPLLAIVSFMRWIQLLYKTGAYRFLDIGFRIVPIFKSFFNVSGIAMIMLFTFLAFLHAFAALENADDISPWQVFLNAFRLLLIGDGDGVDYVLGLGGRPPGGELITQCFFYFGVIIFCVCILNLFIAVHGGVYEVESARMTENFYQNRANICLDSMMQPHWRYRLPTYPLVCYLGLLVVALPIWASLILSTMHPVVPAVWLCMALLVGDAIVRKRPPWDERDGHPWQEQREREPARRISPTPSSPTVVPTFPPDGRPGIKKAATTAGAALMPGVDGSREVAVTVQAHGVDTAEFGTPAGAETARLAPDGSSSPEGSPGAFQWSRTYSSPGTMVRSRPSKTGTPGQRPEMFLWWCSWADAEDPEDTRSEPEHLLSDGVQTIAMRMCGLHRRFDQQDTDTKQLRRRLESLDRSFGVSKDALSQNMAELATRVDRFGGHFEGLEERLCGLGQQLQRMEKTMAQAAPRTLEPLSQLGGIRGGGSRRHAVAAAAGPAGASNQRETAGGAGAGTGALGASGATAEGSAVELVGCDTVEGHDEDGSWQVGPRPAQIGSIGPTEGSCTGGGTSGAENTAGTSNTEPADAVELGVHRLCLPPNWGA